MGTTFQSLECMQKKYSMLLFLIFPQLLTHIVVCLTAKQDSFSFAVFSVLPPFNQSTRFYLSDKPLDGRHLDKLVELALVTWQNF